MNQSVFSNTIARALPTTRSKYYSYWLVILAGFLGPLGFAPFHMPGLTIISLAFLYSELSTSQPQKGLLMGFLYGCGFFGLGVSWVIISIHDYGQIPYILAFLITLLFIMYLALFPALCCMLFCRISTPFSALFKAILFSSLWCLSEILRSQFLTGFPWLLVGTPLIDTPIKFLAPIIGSYGLNWICIFLAALLVHVVKDMSHRRYYYLSAFVLIMISPSLVKDIHWTNIKEKPISVGIVQPNLSMRDKWDEKLFWDLLDYYSKSTTQLLGTDLIVFPESAIPLPSNYLQEYLRKLSKMASKANSALLVGILQPANNNETSFYNSILGLGRAEGEYNKRHLVPFGEYIPQPFVSINRWLNLPEPNVVQGIPDQQLISIHNDPIASLICYELAYPSILRIQMPLAQWIVSISDNGWFGHSLASYQQLQMSQLLSLLTGRYQILVNNDGLSSVINDQGVITDGLPAFQTGSLKSTIYSAEGSTPWILFGDYPTIIFCSLIVMLAFISILRK